MQAASPGRGVPHRRLTVAREEGGAADADELANDANTPLTSKTVASRMARW
jgi:hypothetical protein